MMCTHETIIDMADRYEAILLDAYGVFWGGNEVGLFPGVLETLEMLKTKDKIIGILSNSTQLGHAMVQKFHSKGLELSRHFDFLVSSGDIAKDVFTSGELGFETPNKKYVLFNPAHPKYSSPHALFEGSIFTEAPAIEEADFIYLSIPHRDGEDQTEPELFRERVLELARYKLPVVCANPDRFAHEGQPARAVVRQGSIADMFREAGSRVIYMGKPDPSSFKAAMQQFERHGISDPAKVLMVGDTPETDIKGAKEFGMAQALIMETGIMKERQNESLPEELEPTYRIRKLAHEPF